MRIRLGIGVTAAACTAVAALAQVIAAAPARATTAVTAAYVPPRHDLFYGNKGAAVRSVQRRLAQLHYYPGPVDGKYGADLEQAVWAFKEVQGLPMTRWSNSVVTWAFRKALVHPQAAAGADQARPGEAGSRSTRTSRCWSCTGTTSRR